ncbi:MAG TPA: hypothetical protein VNQ77_07195 [Frankiaceae bacterium]|nr:hypothetical protein [Frankiaceae bacterium]
MRTLAAALVLVAAVACTNDGEPEPTSAPTPTASATREPIGGTLGFTTARQVRLALPDGTVRTLAGQAPEADSIAWTGDGRYVGWFQQAPGGGSALVVHEPATSRTATWEEPNLSTEGLLGTETGFVTTYRPAGKRSMLVVADPAKMLAGGKPRVVPLRLRAGALLTARGPVLVEEPKPGAAFAGGPSTVYELTTDGRATPFFANPRDYPVHHAAVTTDGRRVVHSAGDRINRDRTREWVVVRDLAAKRELPIESPVRRRAEPAVLSIVTGADGRIVATLAYLGPQGEDVASEAYALVDDGWRHVAADARWAASGPDERLAVITRDDQLQIGGDVFAEGVQAAAWAPA